MFLHLTGSKAVDLSSLIRTCKNSKAQRTQQKLRIIRVDTTHIRSYTYLGEAKASRRLSWRRTTAFACPMKGVLWETKSQETSSQDCFLELIHFFLFLLHSLKISGHWPILLSKFQINMKINFHKLLVSTN